jgi:hypothetical protein
MSICKRFAASLVCVTETVLSNPIVEPRAKWHSTSQLSESGLDTSRSRHADDIDFAAPKDALALIDRHVQELIAEL